MKRTGPKILKGYTILESIASVNFENLIHKQKEIKWEINSNLIEIGIEVRLTLSSEVKVHSL